MPGRIAVAVKPFEESKSALWFSDKTKRELAGGDRPIQGRIIAVGEADANAAPDQEFFLNVGDLVVFGKYSGVELTYGRAERVIILAESNILAKLDDDEIVAEVKVRA